MSNRTQGRSNDFIGAWARPTCWSWRRLQEVEAAVGSLWGQGHWWWKYCEILTDISSLRGCPFVTQTWPHSRYCRLQCWDASGQTTSRVGTQPQSSTGRLPKTFLSPELSLNILLTLALHAKGTRPSSIHQWIGTRRLHHEACTSL